MILMNTRANMGCDKFARSFELWPSLERCLIDLSGVCVCNPVHRPRLAAPIGYTHARRACVRVERAFDAWRPPAVAPPAIYSIRKSGRSDTFCIVNVSVREWHTDDVELDFRDILRFDASRVNDECAEPRHICVHMHKYR